MLKKYANACNSTHKHDFEVAALQGLEKVCDSRLQTATDEDAVVDVVQEDRSESVDVT